MHRNREDEDDDDFDDGYDPDEPETYPHGVYDDDGPATIPCPHCGKEVLEDSERCPYCETYWSQEDTPTNSRRGWWMVMAVLAILAVLMWII